MVLFRRAKGDRQTSDSSGVAGADSPETLGLTVGSAVPCLRGCVREVPTWLQILKVKSGTLIKNELRRMSENAGIQASCQTVSCQSD